MNAPLSLPTVEQIEAAWLEWLTLRDRGTANRWEAVEAARQYRSFVALLSRATPETQDEFAARGDGL